MSPHNYNMKFNGSNSINVSDQEEFSTLVNRVFMNIVMFVYRVSGLHFFFTRRFFERGIKDDTAFREKAKALKFDPRSLGPNQGMQIHPQYTHSYNNQNPNNNGISV